MTNVISNNRIINLTHINFTFIYKFLNNQWKKKPCKTRANFEIKTQSGSIRASDEPFVSEEGL